MIKRMIALLLVLIFSIESLAAVVSDNDGSAFITKAEFDSLKNNFQSQIDQYNTSIDSKIDGAIASYLSGIKVESARTVEPIIENYDEICWVPNVKFYGRYRTFTGRTTYTENSANGWYEPKLNEKAIWMRLTYFRFVDYQLCNNSNLVFTINANQNNASNGVIWNSSANGPRPVGVRFLEDDYGNYNLSTVHPFIDTYVMSYMGHSEPHDWTNLHQTGGTSLQQYNLGSANIDQIILNLISPGNNLMEFEMKMRVSGTSTYRYGTSQLNSKNFAWPSMWAGAYNVDPESIHTVLVGDCGLTEALSATAWATFSNPILTTLSEQRMTSTALPLVENLFVNSMFGLNNNVDANAVYMKGKQVGEDTYLDFSKSTSFGSIAFTTSCVQVANLSNDSYRNLAYNTDAKSGSLKVPHWPTIKLKDINSRKFYNGENSLKYGQGIPMLLTATDNGYMQISFDYDVKYLLDNSISNKRIYVSIKKSDYLNDSSDYVDGYTDLVDINNPTVPSNLLKDCQYEDTSGKGKITIPVKKDDSIWFRMSPQNETGGYYAKMSNLKITMFTQ